MANPGNASIGTATELQGVAPTGTSVNKFSIYDYTEPLPSNLQTFHTRFNLYLTGGASGTWSFWQGDGAMYSDNNAFSGAQVFTGIRWVFGASGAITTNIRVGAAWVTTGLPATPFAQDTLYYVEIYGNNSASSANYSRGGSSYSVASNQWDLWINGTRSPGLGKAQLADAANVDSFLFYGESSTANVATIILDDFLYGGDLSTVPVTVSGFSID